MSMYGLGFPWAKTAQNLHVNTAQTYMNTLAQHWVL